ncbi:PHO85 cyclin-5 [Elasticomyces elasticus]|nr:PHO85 cyclin-5 [Elasticomyces elasticus]
MTPCRQSSNGRGVLPLKTYIEETLRRSRTSYSTLQVALYYLVLIKPFVPKYDFTTEQPFDSPGCRALQCGRRMFLAALILASKYLQDRNFSAKAWSKMSGLKVCEINLNEMAFLRTVDWKLHIPGKLFQRWTEIVLRYTPSRHSPPGPPSPGSNVLSSDPWRPWKRLVPLLTPALDMHISDSSVPNNIQAHTRSQSFLIDSSSQDNTPTPTTTLPPFLEPDFNPSPPTPGLARMGPLPTPQMTPSFSSETPAARIISYRPRRPSMCSATAQANSVSIARSAVDRWTPVSSTSAPNETEMASRRNSSARSSPSNSSPESMFSDKSARSSRASSISSTSTSSTGAPSQTCLARLATRRSTRLPYPISTRSSATQVPGACSEALSAPLLSGAITSSPASESLAIAEQPGLCHELKRGHKRIHSSNNACMLQQDVQAMLRENSQLDFDTVVEDSHVAAPSNNRTIDRAVALCREPPSTGRKATQPPVSLSATPSDYIRRPVERKMGRKRTCCSESNPPKLERASSLWGEIL